MAASQKLIKWLMLTFNLLFWVSGIGLIIVGAVAQTHYKPYLSFLDGGYVSAPVLLIVVGAIITIIAFFGCCGSSKESYCMLMTFAVLLGIIFVVELAGGIAGYVERGRVEDYLGRNMHEKLQNFNVSKDSRVWDFMQTDLDCCGVESYKDWIRNSSIAVPPASCCRFADQCDRNASSLAPCATDVAPSSCPIYTEGCLNILKNKLERNIAAIGGVGVGVAFIQLIGICFACFLARRIRRGYTYAA